jgi:O-antigen ligase
VFLSTSRGSLLIATVCLAFLVLLAPNLRRSAVYVAIGGLTCLALLSQFSSFEVTTMQRVQLLFDPSQSARTRTSGRLDLALGGWYIFQEHPMGVGTGAFSRAWADLGRREGLSRFHQGKATPAHSGWVKVLAENGLPGILLLISYVLSFSIVGWSTHDRRLRLLGLLVTSVLGIALIPVELSHKDLLLLAQGAALFFHHGLGQGRRMREG